MPFMIIMKSEYVRTTKNAESERNEVVSIERALFLIFFLMLKYPTVRNSKTRTFRPKGAL